MLVCNKPEYKALVQAIMVANGYNNEQAEYALENAIGNDLQYIRINGTLIGGMIGLILYSISMWLA